jgi:transcriptional antiterminator RfaH
MIEHIMADVSIAAAGSGFRPVKDPWRWYLIHTKPSSELIAQVNLNRQGYEVYFPRLMRSIHRRGRFLDQVTALFPCYLFLRLHEGDQPLGPVRSSVGVNCVVRFGSHYAVVPDRLIRELRAHADPESGLHRMDSRPSLESGAKVSITMGSFKGLEGIFEREAGVDRVVVLLSLLGQDVPVRLPACIVLPSNAA